MRHTLWGLIALVVTAALVACAVPAETVSSGSGDAQGTSQEKQTETTAGIGDTAKDGKFAFTVTEMTTAQTLGPKLLQEGAQGKYVLVHMTVENIGDSAQYLSASNQYLLAGDKRFSADDSAWALVEGNSLLEQINPGNTVKGIVVFDVPEDLKPKIIELHDSAFSGGVRVKLR